MPLIGVWKNEADGWMAFDYFRSSGLTETASKTGKCRTDGDDGQSQSETATVTGNANGSRDEDEDGDGDLNELVLVMS